MIRRFAAILLLAGACLGQTPGTKEIQVAPEVLSRYVGIYAMSPTVNMTITLVDDQLVSQMTGQGKVAIVAGIGDDVLPAGINAEIDFPKDDKGLGKPANPSPEWPRHDQEAPETTPRRRRSPMLRQPSTRDSRTRPLRRAARPRCAG